MPRCDRAFTGKVNRKGKSGMAHLSLTTLAALTPPEWEVTIHDARVSPVDPACDADLVGITAFTAEIPSAYAMADAFRTQGKTVVMGGIHASALPEEALEHADCVVIGEAEETWPQALRDFEAGSLQQTYRASGYCAMEKMAIPRRDLLRREQYVTGFYTLQATRGCPFDCDYCAVTGVFGRKYRARPVAEVIEEIRSFPEQEFFFVDDNICGQPKYAKELFRALMPLGKTWGGQASITFARDEELLDLYCRSGGRYAFIGIETVAAEGLASVNKAWNRADEYGEAIRRIHRAGINILGSFIFGLDTDDVGVFDRTLAFIMEHNIDAAQFHILTPFPGTRLYEQFESEGRILIREWDRYHTGECVIQPKNMTPEELEQGYYRIYREMYSLPNILRRLFHRPSGFVTRAKMNFGYRNRALRMPQA